MIPTAAESFSEMVTGPMRVPELSTAQIFTVPYSAVPSGIRTAPCGGLEVPGGASSGLVPGSVAKLHNVNPARNRIRAADFKAL